MINIFIPGLISSDRDGTMRSPFGVMILMFWIDMLFIYNDSLMIPLQMKKNAINIAWKARDKKPTSRSVRFS